MSYYYYNNNSLKCMMYCVHIVSHSTVNWYWYMDPIPGRYSRGKLWKDGHSLPCKSHVLLLLLFFKRLFLIYLSFSLYTSYMYICGTHTTHITLSETTKGFHAHKPKSCSFFPLTSRLFLFLFFFFFIHEMRLNFNRWLFLCFQIRRKTK